MDQRLVNSDTMDGTLLRSLAAHGMYTSRTPVQNQRQSLIRPQSRPYHQFSTANRQRHIDTKKDVYTWTVGESLMIFIL